MAVMVWLQRAARLADKRTVSRFRYSAVAQQIRQPKQAYFVLTAVAAAAASGAHRVTCCDGPAEDDEDDDDDNEDFNYRFAKPPVTPAPISLSFSVKLLPGVGGSRPSAEVVMQSTFSLPVERGWPRDSLLPDEVAVSMRGALADRLPRFAADQFGVELQGAPPQWRGGLAAWPSVDSETPPATFRHWLLPGFAPPLLSLHRLSEVATGDGFSLGGIVCAGAQSAELHVACEALGCFPGAADEDERLDIRLTTRLVGFPVAGRAWALVGCGGQWWFETVRLPLLKGMFEDFHRMVHEQMMVYYVAALKS